MSDLYEQMTTAIQNHWKAHNNAYPQSIELTDASWNELISMRKLVQASMAFSLQPGWDQHLLGVPVHRGADHNEVVCADGQRLPL